MSDLLSARSIEALPDVVRNGGVVQGRLRIKSQKATLSARQLIGGLFWRIGGHPQGKSKNETLRMRSPMSVRLGFRPCSHCLRRYARQAAGFTLIEMMVTVAIVAVLAVLAAPSYTEFLIRNRSASISNEFTSSVLRARSTAVTRNACVTMCRADASATTAACAPTGGWTGGWITFTNPNCDATLDAPAAADDLIGSAGPFDTSFSMVSNAANTGKLMFSPSGSPRPGDAGRFDLQYLTTGSTRTSNRGICLSSLGRTHLVAYGGTCP